jgi:hydrogenase-4 component B
LSTDFLAEIYPKHLPETVQEALTLILIIPFYLLTEQQSQFILSVQRYHMTALLAEALDPFVLVVCAALLAACSGIPALLLSQSSNKPEMLATTMMLSSSLLGLVGGGIGLFLSRPIVWVMEWSLPFGPCELGIDSISAFFVIPLFILSSCCTVYSMGYGRNPRSSRRVLFFTGTLVASMALLIISRNSVFFLMAWEIMALSCYFVMTAEDDKEAVREAGILYMITTHIGTLALFAMFSLLRGACGNFLFPAAGSLDGAIPLALGIFITALLGFGLKAGLMPLHIWLPSAHANAPSHISALMSGLLIKMGIYGLVRICSFFNHPPLSWGIVVLVVGLVSGVLGVIFALGQHDIKRLLAYHSIENIGIIAMGIGVALIGKSTGNPLLVILGMAGALLHTLNHALFKSLLFLGAGAVIHEVHTREIDLMGGLAKSMPWTSCLFLIGAAAICGLPPLNGFVSELFIYLGFFTGIIGSSNGAIPVMALAVPALALIGALAVACFVKVYGIAFLGLPREQHQHAPVEPGWQMRGPMVVLALLCICIGVIPQAAASLLVNPLRAWAPQLTANVSIQNAAPLGWLSAFALGLLALAAILAYIFVQRLRSGQVGSSPTWDCGYIKPAATMQYTASSFAEMLVNLFRSILQPHMEKPAINGVIPARARFASHVPEVVLELLVAPLLTTVDAGFARIRRLQHGQLHLYILYVFVTLILLLTWALHSG